MSEFRENGLEEFGKKMLKALSFKFPFWLGVKVNTTSHRMTWISTKQYFSKDIADTIWNELVRICHRHNKNMNICIIVLVIKSFFMKENPCVLIHNGEYHLSDCNVHHHQDNPISTVCHKGDLVETAF